EEALRFWVRYVTHHFESPLLSGPIHAAVSLLGATPASLLTWMPKITPLVFRDVYDVRIESIEAKSAKFHFHVQSDVYLNEPVYEVVTEAIVRALFVFTKVEGDVSVRRDLKRRTYDIEATWR